MKSQNTSLNYGNGSNKLLSYRQDKITEHIVWIFARSLGAAQARATKTDPGLNNT